MPFGRKSSQIRLTHNFWGFSRGGGSGGIPASRAQVGSGIVIDKDANHAGMTTFGSLKNVGTVLASILIFYLSNLKTNK